MKRHLIFPFFSFFFLVCNLTAASQLIESGFVSALVPPSPASTTGERLFSIYLPDGYDTSSDTYPVVYFLPSFNANNTTFAPFNQVILDDLISQQRIIPMIVVHLDPSLESTPSLTRYNSSWYVDSELNGLWEQYIFDELIPFIDAEYRTKPTAAYRAIMGHSMGGFGSLLHGTRRPDIFCAIGAASPTPTWLMISDMATPGNQLFFLNSVIFTELPPSGEVNPDNGDLTYIIFSLSGALSPDLSGSTPFAQNFFVKMPFQVNGTTAQPITAPLFNQGVDFNDTSTCPVPFTNFISTLIIDPAVVTQWQQNDPYEFVPAQVGTLQKQQIYVDAGDLEQANNVGVRFLSDLFTSNNIDHEYLLYQGYHDECLIDPACSRFHTIFQLMSAKFAEGGVYADDVRVKILGNQTINILGTFSINDGSFLGVETDPSNGITATNVTFNIQNNGKLLIGDSTTAGGGLQVGNPFGKPILQNNPSYLTNQVACSFLVNGPEARLEIGKQGFLGLGVGITGKALATSHLWAVKALTNVTDISLTIENGEFVQDRIASGETTDANLLALGPSAAYSILVNPTTGKIRGGANIIQTQDTRMQHPGVFHTAGDILPGGIRPFIQSNPTQKDCYYRVSIASERDYENIYDAELLSSTPQLDDRGSSTPFSITNVDLETAFTFLAQQSYQAAASKEGAIAVQEDGNIKISVKDNGNLTRYNQDQIIIGTHQHIDLNEIAHKDAAIGIQIETVDNQRIPIRVYDLTPEEN